MYLQFINAGGQIINNSTLVEPSGFITEGWQRMENYVTVPPGTVTVRLVLNSADFVCLWDDIRIYPLTGNIKTYVYDKNTYRVSATLDNNNYATLYYYDSQGNLFLLKKETEKGIQTIQESFSHQKEK